ncbi:MAG: alpha-N-acetylglucosaminidase [Ruminococcaceae bacterium]|nr:alpha-N-acetylglucosaminidase [Oscillospiraceae bacterium]
MKIKQQYIDIKNKNIPDNLNVDALYALIERTAGKKYAEKFVFEKIDSDGFDTYEVFDKGDKICIRANTGVSAAVGFNKYLKEICHYSIGALATSGTLPENPPKVQKVLKNKSSFLYRYFFNYCTFSYTYAFDSWQDWERTLDYLILSGYNLILNPIGLETVWYRVLKKLGYSTEDIKNFICGPAFYTWQWVFNLSGWAGGAPDSWYEERAELAAKFNNRLLELGASPILGGYVGMVPDDFCNYYADSKPLKQGIWGGFVRPAYILPEDPNFNKVADLFYAELMKIGGADKVSFFSADAFHEGGNKEGVNLPKYALSCYEKMREFVDTPVWVIQEWGSPKLEIPDSVNNKYDGGALLVALSADRRDTAPKTPDVSPWCYCAVNAFGGQEVMQGAATEQLLNPFIHLKNENSKILGIGYMPESVNANEIFYSIFADNAFGEGYKSVEDFIKAYTRDRYGRACDDITDTLKKVFVTSFHIDRLLGAESGLCARPSLTVRNVSAYSNFACPYIDQSVLVNHVKALFSHYDEFSNMGGYKRDLLEATRQILNNLSWYFIEEMKTAYKNKDIDGVSKNGAELLGLYKLQNALVSTDKKFLLGTWLEKAKACGKTPAEKAYFEWNARHQITLWAAEKGSGYSPNSTEGGLRDYAAKEWNGMLEDFYKPRWERFISRLQISLLTGKELEPINNYHEELGFVYEKKSYPTEPFGCLKTAVKNIIEKVDSVKFEYKEYKPGGIPFEEFIAKSFEDATNG